MKSLECLNAAVKQHRDKAVLSLLLGQQNNFLVHTAIALALEWATQEGEGEFDVDKFANDSIAESTAELAAAVTEPAETVTDSPCEDTDTDGECDTHDHNKALNAGGRE